jgi:nanoRNase/pAp phosphatase (c-di-AMP/oligoRNAs hydrolase)
METPFRVLAGLLDRTRPVLIQTHDFPDHDAVGAAYGLRELLRRKGFMAEITCGTGIQSISLAAMIARMGIAVTPFDTEAGDHDIQTIVVDGSPASGTVKTVAGTLVGVIDHHPAKTQLVCPFADIRLGTGSCSSIVWTYWRDESETPDKTTATALLAGIQLDTDFLSRRVSRTDLDAHYSLFFLGDCELAREVVRMSLSLDQLTEIGRAFVSFRTKDSVILAELCGDYSGELLSVLADFLLRLREITFTVVIANGPTDTRLSARTRDRDIDAGSIIRKVLSGRGSGGGHPHMAGGCFTRGKYPGADHLLEEIAAECAASAEHSATHRSSNETDNQAN